MIRLFDFILSLFALIMLSPVFLIVIPILSLTGEGEIFYLQKRIGKNGKTFKIIKFVTMTKNSEFMEGGTITVENDPRILPIGHFLRSSKINELPQIINILIGDMSIIGPRPLTEETISYYEENAKKIVLSVKPGLSGIGSIIFRDEQELLERTEDRHKFYSEYIAPYKLELELWYVEKRTLTLNFLLIFLTLTAVLIKGSQYHWRFFKSLPEPPLKLKKTLQYSVRS